MPLTADQRECRKLRRYLRDLTAAVRSGVKAIDAEAKRPDFPTLDTGKRLARIANFLEMANDTARHFALGESLKPKKR